MKRFVGTGLFAALALTCAPLAHGEEPKKKVAVPAADLARMVIKLNDTGLRTAAAIRTKDKNFVYYPGSASPVLSSVSNGTSGNALVEVKRATGWAGGDNTEALEGIFKPQRTGDFTLKTANALWAVKSMDKKWVEGVKRETGALVIEVKDGASHKELADEVNAFVKKQTDGEVDKLVKESDFDRVRFVVSNATFVKGLWVSPFDKKKTKEDDFTLAGGEKVKAMYLNSKAALVNYRVGDAGTCVLLPVKGNVVFGAVLPDEGKFDEAFALVNQALFDDIKDSLSQPAQVVALKFPKFKTSSGQMDLIPAYKKLGMKKIFEGARDDGQVAFGRVTTEDIWISTFRQQATLEVDEMGFKGGAGTVAIATGRALSPSIEFNRPFHFFVVDLTTGQLLIIGSLVDPTK